MSDAHRIPSRGLVTGSPEDPLVHGYRPGNTYALDPPKLHRHILSEVPRHTTNLCKVGGSVMLAVPPAPLDLLNLGVGAKKWVSVWKTVT